GTLFLSGFTAYAIIAHRLFDIRIIIRRTVVYSGLLAFALGTYSVVVLFFAQLFGGGQGTALTVQGIVPNFIAALLIAIGFEPLRRWLTNVTDAFLFKGEYNSEDVLHKLAGVLGSVIDLDEAIVAMMDIVVREMRLTSAATFILKRSLTELSNGTAPADTHKQVIELKRVKKIGYPATAELTLEPNDPLISFFGSVKHPIVTEEYAQVHLGNTAVEGVIAKLHKFQAAVAMPIFVRNQLIGISVVGEKKSGDAFTDQDLKVLDIAATETAAAIEKARFFEEDQVKSEFVSIASHELLTPTAAIEGYLSMILDEHLAQVDEKARQYLTRVYGSARRLSTLVKDLLNVSRIEAGRIVLDRKPIDLVRIIQGVIDDLKFNAQKNDVTLQFAKPPQPIPAVFADPEKTSQIIINLVSNAIKYNKPKGRVALSLRTDGQFVMVSIADTGHGIPEPEQKHLFEKFYRASNASTSVISGTGLGLFIVKQIIALMDGEIHFTSKEEQGSTFWITLPIAKSKAQRQISGDPKLMTQEQQAIARGAGSPTSPQGAPAPAQAAAPIAKPLPTK
ncbi:HAMP domain-containing histidine kinase, partial [Candidatus Berkelbacteria bacterium]|nr:HAMP domain-containing histidine kinase [Candidatus Berkelbacteria bacterium]